MSLDSTDTHYVVQMVKTLSGPNRKRIIDNIRRMSIQQVRVINFKKLLDPEAYKTTIIRQQLSDSHKLEL